MSVNQSSEEPFPTWQDLEETGAGDGLPIECERCGKLGTPRQQFTHMGVTISYICANERDDELRMKGVGLGEYTYFAANNVERAAQIELTQIRT